MLGIDISKIHISWTSTEFTHHSIPTAGSTASDLNGPAVMDACQKINQRLRPYKEAKPEASWEEWVKMAFMDRASLTATGVYDGGVIDFDVYKMTGVPFEYFVFGAGCVEVEVNCPTGDWTVNQADVVIDAGKSINPAIDVGQIEGAFIQVCM